MKKILVVDDSQDNLYYLKTLLEASNYQVAIAYDGEEALRKLAAGGFDLIVSDILMPVMGGFLLCHECGKDEELRNIPFVFYTATYTDEMDQALTLKMGAATFIRKPIEPSILLEKIEKVIEEGNSRPSSQDGQVIGESELLKGFFEKPHQLLLRKW